MRGTVAPSVAPTPGYLGCLGGVVGFSRRFRALAGSSHVLSLNKVAADRVIVAKQHLEFGRPLGGKNVMFRRTQSGIAELWQVSRMVLEDLFSS